MSGIAVAQPGFKRRLMVSRLICAMAVFVIAASLASAIAGYVLLKQADTQHGLDHRAGLLAAIDELRGSEGQRRFLDSTLLARLERVTGVKGLAFDSEPQASPDRELQSMVDGQGRIVGWLSWDAHRSLETVSRGLVPLLTMTGLVVLGFALFALWHVRRTVRDLVNSEQRAWSLAHEDMLTRLPNHRKLSQFIDAALQARGPGDLVTVALIDIDGLNEINQLHGQQAGDELLALWSRRLRDDLGDHACARFDGDQFAVILTGFDRDGAVERLRALATTLERPFWIADRAVQVASTLGVAHAPIHAETREDLLRRVELALRAGKRKNRGGLTHFDPAMDIEVAERRFIERELKRALADRVLDVHYQPIVTADGARIVGAEALLRWTHPERGAIPPAIFVAIAEQSGLMSALGEFVLRRALDDAKRWPEIFIAVNLSPVQVRDPALVELVLSALADSGLSPERVILEVTEGVLIDNPDEAKLRLDALRAVGVRLALDDFGTGYSSLTYLQRFHFDKLKIDKGFVDPLGTSADAQAILLGIVGLGRALGLSMLAEGVETEEQRVLLRLAGCEEMQGYLFGKPAPRETLDKLLIERRTATRGLQRVG